MLCVVLGVLHLVHLLNAIELIINVLVGHQKTPKLISDMVSMNMKLCFDGCITKKQKC